MANPGQSRVLTAFYWFLALILITVGVVTVRALTHEKVEVQVARVGYQTLSSTVSTNGKVEPVEEFAAHAPFPGVIQKIYVEVGQHVGVGALLVQMNDADAKSRIATAQAQVDSAKLALRDVQQNGSFDDRNRNSTELATNKVEQQNAQANLDTVKALNAKGAASAGEVTAAEQRLMTANLAVKSASDRVGSRYNAEDREGAAARVRDAQAALQAARAAEDNVSIRSRVAGTVYSVPVSEYDFVPSGDDILDVADLSRLQVRAYFDEPEIGKLAKGQAVAIVWDAKPNKQWHGHIERAPSTVMSYGTRNVGECLITVDDPSPDLIPNTNVTVKVTEMQRKDVLSVPREAWHNVDGRSFVYKIVNGKLAVTPVKEGVVTLTSVEIVSGLSPNDVVVLRAKSATTDLTNGLEVKAIE